MMYPVTDHATEPLVTHSPWPAEVRSVPDGTPYYNMPDAIPLCPMNTPGEKPRFEQDIVITRLELRSIAYPVARKGRNPMWFEQRRAWHEESRTIIQTGAQLWGW